jgi:hypothetical protein
VVALSLGGLRRKIEIAMLPAAPPERRSAATPAPRDRSVGAAAIAHLPQLGRFEVPIAGQR